MFLFVLLSGCAGVGTTPAPVEDRSAPGETGKQPDSTAISREQAGSADAATTAELANVPQPAQPELSKSANQQALSTTPDEPVVLAVLDEAETLASKGDMPRAMASLERGIRIKPKDPWLWHQLSVLKLRDRQWLDAVAMAKKSNSLAGNNQQLLASNWMIIAEAKEALGELSASRAAQRRAEQYSGGR